MSVSIAQSGCTLSKKGKCRTLMSFLFLVLKTPQTLQEVNYRWNKMRRTVTSVYKSGKASHNTIIFGGIKTGKTKKKKIFIKENAVNSSLFTRKL